MTAIYASIIMSVMTWRVDIILPPPPRVMIREVIAKNWLSTSGAGDFNGDGVCNLEDYDVITSDLLNYWRAWYILLPPPEIKM